MSGNFSRLLRGIFAGLDLLTLNILFFSAKLFVDSSGIPDDKQDLIMILLFINISWLGSAWIYSIYQGKSTNSFSNFVKKTLQAYVLFFILCICALYFQHEIQLPRLFIIAFLTAFLCCLFFNRMLYLVSYLYFRNKDYLARRVLIIGHNPTSIKLAGYLTSHSKQVQIVGICEHEELISELTPYPILSTPAMAIETSTKFKVNEIYSTILPSENADIYRLMDEADKACIRFKLVPNFQSFMNRPYHVNHIGDLPLLTQRPEPLDDLANRIKKRVFDILVSGFVILFVLSWLIPLLSILILLESRGPIFFIQMRSGVNNEPFRCLKFRSMRVNTNSDKIQATKSDARLTRIGKFMRKTSLDEFPQFFNVFLGSMSVVGPRPHMLKHTEDYSQVYAPYMVRHFLKPGITGWAQIHGYRGEIKNMDDIRNRVDYDIWYLENWHEWLDLRIIVMTAYNIFKGEENAY